MEKKTRQPFQVAVFQFRIREQTAIEYLLLKRTDGGYWQPIAGGGECDETSVQTALRESYEEAGITHGRLLKLTTLSYIPTYHFRNADSWPRSTVVIPNYYFALECSEDPQISDEHTDYIWVDYANANKLLKWDDNKTALWEIQASFERDPSGFIAEFSEI